MVPGKPKRKKKPKTDKLKARLNEYVTWFDVYGRYYTSETFHDVWFAFLSVVELKGGPAEIRRIVVSVLQHKKTRDVERLLSAVRLKTYYHSAVNSEWRDFYAAQIPELEEMQEELKMASLGCFDP